MFFLSRKRREQATAQRLYEACLQAARRPAMFNAFGVADTMQGRFEMLTLHLFPVLYRLMHVPGDDPELARAVSEAFVNDMDDAFREIGVSDVKVPRRMKELYRSFAGRIGAYNAAFAEGESALAAAVARNVYPDETFGDGSRDRRALDLARYVRSSVEAVRGADLGDLRRGRAPFPPAQHSTMETTP